MDIQELLKKYREYSSQDTTLLEYAWNFASEQHKGQKRASGEDYFIHPAAVADILVDYKMDIETIAAGLLHDVLEDCGAEHEAPIRERFGDAVAGIVKDCTDGTSETKTKLDTPEAKCADWRNRKLAYIASLEKKPIASLLVSTCDKLHNARAIVADVQGDAGLAVFERFKVGKEGTLRYYESLARASSREPLE